MALMINLESAHGLAQSLYWRLNSFDQLGNREPDGSRIPAIARFRAYVSEEAFRAGKAYLEEMLISFVPTSASADMAAEAYAALKAHDPSADTEGDLDASRERLIVATANVSALSAEVDRLEAALAAKPRARASANQVDDAKRHLAAAQAERAKLQDALEMHGAAHAAAIARRKAIATAADV